VINYFCILLIKALRRQIDPGEIGKEKGLLGNSRTQAAQINCKFIINIQKIKAADTKLVIEGALAIEFIHLIKRGVKL